MPFSTPVLLLDSGANLEIDEKTLEQFAVMGSVYMEKIYGLDCCARWSVEQRYRADQRSGLVPRTPYRLLEASETINFVGNVEGKEVPFDACDVLVCDGFTGNIMLKTVEGLSKFFMSTLKGVFGQNLLTKASAIPLRGSIAAFKKQFDSAEHGGAPLLGISKPVIKAHGSSDARAILNAVRQAIAYIDTGIIYDIAAHASDFQAQAGTCGDFGSDVRLCRN